MLSWGVVVAAEADLSATLAGADWASREVAGIGGGLKPAASAGAGSGWERGGPGAGLDERLAATARAGHGPDMRHTLQRIVDLAAAPSMTTESRFA